jgi:poly-beta-1,6-N-acetyl-D-glucosamine synthase
MIQIFFYFSLFYFSLLILVYGLYFLLVLNNSKKKGYVEFIETVLQKNLKLEELPTVSIIIPAHNEADVISNKLHNVAALTYPREKLEVVLVDDRSTDNTAEIVEKLLRELSLPGKIVRNPTPLGVNASYNRAVLETNGDLIVMTDADVMIEPDALAKGAKILQTQKDVGGVSGKMVLVTSQQNAAVSFASSYEEFVDKQSLAESAIYSTYPGSTCFAIIKRTVFVPLNEKFGSSDGNLSLSIISRGLKFLYIPQLLYRENIASGFKEQRRQKIRRGTRLLQSTFLYSGKILPKSGKGFALIIFPLRLIMMAIIPLLFWLGLAGLVGSFFVLTPALAFAALGICSLFLVSLMFSRSLRNLFFSFVVHQFYLTLALVFVARKAKTWKAINRDITVLNSESKAQGSK